MPTLRYVQLADHDHCSFFFEIVHIFILTKLYFITITFLTVNTAQPAGKPCIHSQYLILEKPNNKPINQPINQSDTYCNYPLFVLYRIVRNYINDGIVGYL